MQSICFYWYSRFAESCRGAVFWKTVAAPLGQRSQRVNKIRYWTSVVVGVWQHEGCLSDIHTPDLPWARPNKMGALMARSALHALYGWCWSGASAERVVSDCGRPAADVTVSRMVFNYVDWKTWRRNVLFTLRSPSQRSLNKYNINKGGGNNADDINDQQNQTATVWTVQVVDYWWRNADYCKRRLAELCIVLKKGRILQHPEDEAFSVFYSFESGGKRNSHGLMEMYRGSQGRVAMTTSIYSTMTCFEFLSVLFEYVIRVLLHSQIILWAKLLVFHVCQNAHRHPKR